MALTVRVSALCGVVIRKKWRVGAAGKDDTMKNLNQEAEKADPLHEVLRAWVVDATLPPRFEARVWQRIAQAEARPYLTPWGGLLRWIEVVLPRPKVALSYVMVLFGLGVAVGSWVAEMESSRVDEVLGMRYVQSVDPYKAVAVNR